ncbi:MAG TPA: hypothetical protein VFG14_03385, partial [Chthoniobacteraceae bacterium]|nr:hypothetical protein [Chthoniobacteraceae bacterium]
DGAMLSSEGQKPSVKPRKQTFFRPIVEGVSQSKTPSYSQGLGSYYANEPVPNLGPVGETGCTPTGKHQCPTGMA